MKHFFWLSVAAYVFLYFYAAWLYDGFSMTLAISLFVAVVGFLSWRHRRKLAKNTESNVQTDPTTQISIDTQPLSLWHSPLPYIGIIAVIAIVFIMRL